MKLILSPLLFFGFLWLCLSMKRTRMLPVVTLLLAGLSAKAQLGLGTNGPLTTLEQYIAVNDTNYNGWESNHFTLWNAAVFASVQGTPGASAIGNDLGLEVPVWKHLVSLDSTTRFEQIFGDIHSQQFGVSYTYNLHQIQLSAGLDGRWTFAQNHLNAVPFIELKKASTALHGVGTLIRYGFPIRKNPGGGEIEVGMEVPF